MKYNELNEDVKPDFVNSFRIYPSETEVFVDFSTVDHAATKLKAESEGREKPEKIVLDTKARLIMPRVLVAHLYLALDKIVNSREEEGGDN